MKQATIKLLAAISTAILFFVVGVAMSAHAQDQKEDEKPAAREEAKPAVPAAHPQQEEPSRPPAHEEAKPAPHPETARPPEHQPARPDGRQEAAHPPQQEEPHPATHQEAARPPQQEQAGPTERQPAAHVQEPSEHARPAAESARPEQNAHPQQAQPRSEQAHAQLADWQQHRAQHWQSQHRSWQQRGGYNGYRIPDDRYRAEFGPPHPFRIYSYPVQFVGGYPRFQYGGYWVQMVDPWPESWAPDWYDTDEVYIVFENGGYYLIDPRYSSFPIAVEIFAS